MSYDYQTADPALYRELREYAAWSRNHPTEAERLLWNYLRSCGLGVTFKRQHIIGDFIVDFVCLDRKLVIELDGGYHSLPEQAISDEQRSEWLKSNGFQVIRFTNSELFNNINQVLENIKEYL
jgi:very-short-patch-repair endonuclease